MPDILTHVLVGYILGTLLAVRYEWLRSSHVTLVMIGALSPDFTKISLVVPDIALESLLGVPFSWSPLHTLGGTIIVVTIGALLVAPGHRKQTIALLAVGALSHHALDLLLLNVSGYSYSVFWPLTQYHPPTPNFYLSTDRWPALISGLVAALVWAVDRRFFARSCDT